MLYRINGRDSLLPRFLTVPHEAETPTAAIEWAKRYTVFKPFSERVLLECLQVWDGAQWIWISRE